jgi:hypothetical protein
MFQQIDARKTLFSTPLSPTNRIESTEFEYKEANTQKRKAVRIGKKPRGQRGFGQWREENILSDSWNAALPSFPDTKNQLKTRTLTPLLLLNSQ